MAIFLGIVVLIAAIVFVIFVKNPPLKEDDRGDF